MAPSTSALSVISEKIVQAVMADHVRELRHGYRVGTTKSLPWRYRQLDGMTRFLKENEEALNMMRWMS